MADLGHFLHAIVNGVFNERLNGKRRNPAVQCLRGCLQTEFQLVLKTDLLDRNEGVHKLQLIGQSHQRPLTGKRSPKEIAERFRNLRNLRIADCLGSPVDGFQCVVQKMRADLRAESLKLGILGQQLVDIIDLYQLADSLRHVAEIVMKRADFLWLVLDGRSGSAFLRGREGQLIPAERFHPGNQEVKLADDCSDQPVGNIQHGKHPGGENQNQKAK